MQLAYGVGSLVRCCCCCCCCCCMSDYWRVRSPRVRQQRGREGESRKRGREQREQSQQTKGHRDSPAAASSPHNCTSAQSEMERTSVCTRCCMHTAVSQTAAGGWQERAEGEQRGRGSTSAGEEGKCNVTALRSLLSLLPSIPLSFFFLFLLCAVVSAVGDGQRKEKQTKGKGKQQHQATAAAQ